MLNFFSRSAMLVITVILMMVVGSACSSADPTKAPPQDIKPDAEKTASMNEPAPEPEIETISMEDLAVAITEHVSRQSEMNNGKFFINDDMTGESLYLTFSAVHETEPATIGPDRYFVCADFTNDDGVIYDLDFILRGTAKDNLRVAQVMIHKVNGDPRYSWVEEGGIWKRQTSLEPTSEISGETPTETGESSEPGGSSSEHPGS